MYYSRYNGLSLLTGEAAVVFAMSNYLPDLCSGLYYPLSTLGIVPKAYKRMEGRKNK
jgi:hypothetical protein